MSQETIESELLKASQLSNRLAWLRASVLGANDGILSVASILSGMIAGNATKDTIILSGLAALMAGATAMATGEYVSVSSQYDAEKSDLEHRKDISLHNPNHEIYDLTKLYVEYGLKEELARIVAEKLIHYKADNLGTGVAMLRSSAANPLQAAFASAASFVIGGVLPLLTTIVVPHSFAITGVVFSSLLSLAVLGALGAIVGNTPILKPTLRIIFWGSVSLSLTAAVGNIFKINP